MDLKYRTNDEENHINFAIGDWIIQADDWFGTGRGLGEALHLEPIPHNSCFISYSHKDEDFTRRLYSRLRSANIDVWYAPEDIRGGEKLHEQIDRAIKGYDKLLIVLSENSLRSDWVITEIRKARKIEIKENRRKLFPIRLVDMTRISEWECFDADTGRDLAIEVREYFIPDFSNWENPDVIQTSFSKLLDDLKAL
jgi:TIR domain